MATVTIHEAEANLSDLIARAEAGEEILIARDETPVAKLAAVPAAKDSPDKTDKRRLFGVYAGRFPPIPDAFFFDPLPDEELRLWEGGSEPSSG